MIYKVIINNIVYEVKTKIEAYTIYENADIKANKIILSKESGENFHRLVRTNR